MRQRTVTIVVMIGSLLEGATVVWRHARLRLPRTGVPIQSPTGLLLLVTSRDNQSLSFRDHKIDRDSEFVDGHGDEHDHQQIQNHDQFYDHIDAKHIRKGAVPVVAVGR